MPKEGAPNLAKWIRYFAAHEIPVYAVVDTDSNKTGKQLEAVEIVHADLLAAMGLPATTALRTEGSPIHATRAFASLDANFEAAMKQLFGDDYERLDAAATALLGRSKALRARYVAERLVSEHPAHDGWGALKELGEQIRQALAAEAESVPHDESH